MNQTGIIEIILDIFKIKFKKIIIIDKKDIHTYNNNSEVLENR